MSCWGGGECYELVCKVAQVSCDVRVRHLFRALGDADTSDARARMTGRAFVQ